MHNIVLEFEMISFKYMNKRRIGTAVVAPLKQSMSVPRSMMLCLQLADLSFIPRQGHHGNAILSTIEQQVRVSHGRRRPSCDSQL